MNKNVKIMLIIVLIIGCIGIGNFATIAYLKSTGKINENSGKDLIETVQINSGTLKFEDKQNMYNEGNWEKFTSNLSTVMKEDTNGDGISDRVLYGDLDGVLGDNDNPDGVIYADLSEGSGGTKTWISNGNWNDENCGEFSYAAQTGLKDYYIIKKDYEGPFGVGDVITDYRNRRK